MSTKLTLRIDEDIIMSAKEYSHKTGKSLSKIVSEFFMFINNQHNNRESLPPIVASLKGVLEKKDTSEEDYKSYLERKYL